MYLAAANTLSRVRTTCIPARAWWTRASLSFGIARRAQLQLQFNASPSSTLSGLEHPDEDSHLQEDLHLSEDPQDENSELRELYSKARELRSRSPLQVALADVLDLLHSPKNASLRPDERLLTIMLGRQTYRLSDINRISDALSMAPHERVWTKAIIHAVSAFDMDEALRLYDEAWVHGTPPQNLAAEAIIRGIVYPQTGGRFGELDDILKAVSILKRQMQRQPLKGERGPPVRMSRCFLLTAIVGNPTIPDRTTLIDDIFAAYEERGWRKELHRRASKLLPSIYRAPSHSAAVDEVAAYRSFPEAYYSKLLAAIASIRYDTESFMPRSDLLRFVEFAEARGKGDIKLFVAYFSALRDICVSDRPHPQLLADVRDIEQDALAKYGSATTRWGEEFDTHLLTLYGRLAGSADVLPDLQRCWSRIVASGGRASERALCVALRAFPPSHVREIWDQRVQSGGALSSRLWANWVQALCRMGEVDEAFAVFQEHMGDRHPGANAAGDLFASARSEEEQQRWAELFPTTWNSPRTHRLLRLQKSRPSA